MALINIAIIARKLFCDGRDIGREKVETIEFKIEEDGCPSLECYEDNVVLELG